MFRCCLEVVYLLNIYSCWRLSQFVDQFTLQWLCDQISLQDCVDYLQFKFNLCVHRLCSAGADWYTYIMNFSWKTCIHHESIYSKSVLKTKHNHNYIPVENLNNMFCNYDKALLVMFQTLYKMWLGMKNLVLKQR